MRLFASIGLGLALLGCSATGSPWSDRAATADEAALWSATLTALLVVPGNVEAAGIPDALASAAAAAASDPFDPNECVTTTVAGPTVTYTLDGCDGSFALVHATGTLVVTYADPVDGRIVFHASATELLLNGERVSFEADARVLNDGHGTRTIDAQITAEGRGQRGTALQASSTQTARWMDTWGCLFLDTTDDQIGAGEEEWTGHTEAVSMCIGECPMAGGRVTWTAEATLTVDYGGGRNVRWSVTDGASGSGTLAISCGP